MNVKWTKSDDFNYVGTDKSSGKEAKTASSVDLSLGSNSQLRAIVEVYASDDNKDKFINDFISAWNKVMNNDRFDV
jgi:catalase-peroxidase